MFRAFGEGVGPVLDDGRLILLFDHEGDGILPMLDAASGRELWRTPRGEGTNWAAPLVVTHNGRKQIVVNSPRKVRWTHVFRISGPVTAFVQLAIDSRSACRMAR